MRFLSQMRVVASGEHDSPDFSLSWGLYRTRQTSSLMSRVGGGVCGSKLPGVIPFTISGFPYGAMWSSFCLSSTLTRPAHAYIRVDATTWVVANPNTTTPTQHALNKGLQPTTQRTRRHPTTSYMTSYVACTSARPSVPPTIQTPQSKLKVFSAKRKFRMAIHMMIACQKLHVWASMAERTDSTPGTAAAGESGSEENRRWTFKPGTQTKRVGDLNPTPQRATGYEVSGWV